MTTFHSTEEAVRELLRRWEWRAGIDLTGLGNIPIGTTPGALADMLGDGKDWGLIDRNGDLSALSVVSGSGIGFSHAAQSSTWDLEHGAEECPALTVLLSEYMPDYSSKDHILVRIKINRNSVDGLGERIGAALTRSAGTDLAYGITAGNNDAGTAAVVTQRQQNAVVSVRNFTGGSFITDDELFVVRPATSAAYMLVGRGAGAGTPGGALSAFEDVEYIGQQNSNSSNIVDDDDWDAANDQLYLTFQALNTDGDAVMYVEAIEFFRQRADWQDR